ncbi:MAG: phosphotransferase [Myxococcota bacterium]
MSPDPLDRVPERQRDAAKAAVRAALGGAQVTALRPAAGGASGALTYRVDAGSRSYLLRLETGLNALQNPHHYPCMKAAADAGIAPPLRFADPQQGVALMDFVTQRPLQEYPGGPPALARDLGALIRRLQDETSFPSHPISYLELLDRMLSSVIGSRVFAPGLLDPHRAGLERIREAYPWNGTALVSSHNDPNPRNILFDGTRLWLVDWETSCSNDALTDVAVVTHELAGTPELQDAILRSWLGREPDRATHARLFLMQQLTRMYFACVLFRLFAADPNREPDSTLEALTPAEFVAALQAGRLKVGTPEVLYAFGKMFLAGFLAGLSAPGFADALVVARQSH